MSVAAQEAEPETDLHCAHKHKHKQADLQYESDMASQHRQYLMIDCYYCSAKCNDKYEKGVNFAEHIRSEICMDVLDCRGTMSLGNRAANADIQI